MRVYTPPLGKCTNCNEYIGRPKTGKSEKKATDDGEIFPSLYFCPVCSDSTEWEKLAYGDLDKNVKKMNNVKVEEELDNKVDDALDYEVWQPDYKK